MRKKNNYSLIHYLLLNKILKKIMMKNRKIIVKRVRNGQTMISMSQRKKKNRKRREMTNIIKIKKFLLKEGNMVLKET
jgi:hypothetical protein